MVHAGGRPRTTSPPPEELIELGKEMVIFVKADKDNILHLSEWYTIEKGFTYNEWKKFIEKEEFRPYYEKCLRIIGKKYLNGTVKESLAQRWLRIYFPDLKHEEDETAKFNAALSAEIESRKQPITINTIDYSKALT